MDPRVEAVSRAVAEFVGAPDFVLEQLLASKPELRDPEVRLAIQAFMQMATMRGDQAFARQVAVRGALLARSQIVGPARAVQEYHAGLLPPPEPLGTTRPAPPVAVPAPPADLQGLVIRFVAAKDWAEARRILDEHPELLAPPAQAELAKLSQSAIHQNRPEMVDVIGRHQMLLLRCMELGVDRAFAELRGAGEADVQPERVPAGGPVSTAPPEATASRASADPADDEPWLPSIADRRGREIRVFVSSTFRDMQGEREELVKRVFPEIRKLCEEYGVTWGEVDLRWGVPDEEKAEGRVLPICLAEIDRCRPYFLGLLGERYGWVPSEFGAATLADHPWLSEHTGRSVTELEIVHGVLNDVRMADRAFFYVRDPAYAEARGAGYTEDDPDEAARLGPAIAAERAAERRRRLAALKERIVSSGLPVRTGYADPAALGRLVDRDLRDLIDREYPADSSPDALARDGADHDAFARNRARVYVGRRSMRDRLEANAGGDDPPLVVSGGSGSGKSALLAAWSLEYAAAHTDVTVVTHFVEVSATSSDWAAMCRRLIGELASRTGIEVDEARTDESLRTTFANALAMAAARQRIVLVIDGLDQLDDRGGAPDLVWLPPVIPAAVRLIVSTRPGRPLDELRRRGWPEVEVEPLAVDERRTLVVEYLERLYSKRLDAAHLELIASAEPASNPLYLRALLEELRQWGVHETLGERIAWYLEAPTAGELYTRILERWERDFDRDRPSLVGDAMSLLACARRGLSEAELLELLGTDVPLPAAIWSPLHLAAEGSLVSRGGLLAFGNPSVREAVERRYLGDGRRAQVHGRLADYFGTRELGRRRVDEVPYQLARAERWTDLGAALAELPFLELAWRTDEFDMLARWLQVETATGRKRTEWYPGVIAGPGSRPISEIQALAAMLLPAGCLAEALALQQYLADECGRRGDGGARAKALDSEARIHLLRAENAAALAAAREAAEEYRRIGDRRGLCEALVSVGDAYVKAGDSDRGYDVFCEAEQIARETENLRMLHTCLGNRAAILYRRRELDLALALCREEERLCRALGDQLSLATCLGNTANILETAGRPEPADAMRQEQQRLAEEAGADRTLATCLGEQATTLYLRGRRDEALRLFEREEQICRRIGDIRRIIGSYANLGANLFDHDLDGAMAMREAEVRLSREFDDKECLQSALGNQGAILGTQGRILPALELFQEQYRIASEIGYRSGQVSSLENQVVALQMLGRHAEAAVAREELDRLKKEIAASKLA